LGGTTAQALIVTGFLLALLAPLLPRYQAAGAAGDKAELEKAEALVALELDAFRSDEQAEADEGDAGLPTFGQRQQQQAEQRRAFNAKKKELETKYRVQAKRRAMLESQAGATGSRLHLLIGWLGRLLLIVGLLTLTLESEGFRQKILLIILLVVLFSSLAGVGVGFEARGNLGSAP
jgi:hypothetical protein